MRNAPLTEDKNNGISLMHCWRPFEKGDYDLRDKMVEAWTNFTRTGDPNIRKQKTWLPYTEENPGFMIFNLKGAEAVAEMGQPLPASANN